MIELDASISSPSPSGSVPPVSEPSPAPLVPMSATITTTPSGLPVGPPAMVVPRPGVPIGQQPAVNLWPQYHTHLDLHNATNVTA